MLEVALLLFIAAGGLAMLTRRWQMQAPAELLPTSNQQVLSMLAEGGLYSLSAPGENPRRAAFRDLHLTTDGLAFEDSRSAKAISISFADIQWVSAIDPQADLIPSLSLHLEYERRWRVLWLQMPDAELILLVRVLKQVVNPARSNLGRIAQHPQGPFPASTISETLQGAIEKDADVRLYLLPHLLVVLRTDQVQAKIDLSSIRRVLAVERVSRMLHRGADEGIMRLYSRYETISFALSAYREVAQEISFLARCPVEWITQVDKTDKE